MRYKYIACYQLLRNGTYELKLVVNTEANSPLPVNEGDYDATLGYRRLMEIRDVMNEGEMEYRSADVDESVADSIESFLRDEIKPVAIGWTDAQKADQFSDFFKDVYGYRPAIDTDASDEDTARRFDAVSADLERMKADPVQRERLIAQGWDMSETY
jgi:hypothetical protein